MKRPKTVLPSMSWQPCGAAESCYSLAVPAALGRVVDWLHAVVALSTLTLFVPTDVLTLLWLGIWRSWRLTRRQQARVQGWTLRLDRKGRIHIDDTVRSQIGTRPNRLIGAVTPDRERLAARVGFSYTVCRSLRVPGCVCLQLADDCGKRLEILVFYRYHQRQIYQRLWRFLALQ